MLVSDAIDRAVSRMDFRILAGKDVFLDTAYLGEAVDKEYLTSTLRQQMFSSGCILKEKREQAAFVVEVRGHNRHRPARSAVRHAVDQLADLLGAGCRSTLDPQLASGNGLGPTHGPTGDGQNRGLRLSPRDSAPGLAIGSRHRRQQSPRSIEVSHRAVPEGREVYDHTQFAGDDLHVPLVPEETAPDGAQSPGPRLTATAVQRPEHIPNQAAHLPPLPATHRSDCWPAPCTSDLHPEPANFNQPLPGEPVWEAMKLP